MGVLNRHEDRGYTSEGGMDEHREGRAWVDWGLRNEMFTHMGD